jgi:hypothetical protein
MPESTGEIHPHGDDTVNILNKLSFLITVTFKWLLSTNRVKRRRRGKPVHILFCMVDHYEPGTQCADMGTAGDRVRRLLTEYPKLADRHRDGAGNRPRRTWFYPPHYHCHYMLRDLVALCEKGYGEVELHLHHGKHQPDTAENLEKTIRQCIKEYSLFGIFGSENGKKKYGFVHGDWALDNSRNGDYCGVNNEIEILKETGCIADFTFPSMNEANPSQINSIYYAKNDPTKPKSYDSGAPVKAASAEQGDLMIIQGPLYPFFKDDKLWGLRAFGDTVNDCPPISMKRVDAWISTGICVEGREDWVIVKTHTHGATDCDCVLGERMHRIFDHLEGKYNDGVNYVLHYVTARELYNIIKAVEAGESGSDPEQYRDYKIKPPVYDSSPDISEATEELRALVAKTYRG